MQTALKTAKKFAAERYLLVKQLVPEGDRGMLFDHAVERSQTSTMKSDRQVAGTPAAYSDHCMEDLLERLLPTIEGITGLNLFPTYSYFRVYKTGDVLARHSDRCSCEVSVTANLGCIASSPWPIWIEGPQGAVPVEMQPGDAAVYRGIECPHWRDAFSGKLAAQVFLHYVDQNGPHAEWKFDKRKRLGTAPRQGVRLAEAQLHPDGTIELASGKTASLYPIEIAVWKHLEARRTLPQVVEELMQQFSMSCCEAEVSVMQFISFGEKEDLLAVD